MSLRHQSKHDILGYHQRLGVPHWHFPQGTKMKFKAILLATALVCGAPTLAAAQEVSTSINFGTASSYQFRGINQNVKDDAQIFAGADIGYGDFYVGTWASNVDFGGEANLEVDLYGGYKPKFGAVQFDFGVLAYLYPQEDDLRTFEVKAAATLANEAGFSVTGALFYSPEVGKDGPESLYGEVSALAPIPGAKLGPFSFSANAAIGYYDLNLPLDAGDYTNYKVGLTAATESGWAIDLFYTDTDVDNVDAFEGKTVVQLKRTF
jgi:uncharacterized protein (TIGR02001 family)